MGLSDWPRYVIRQFQGSREKPHLQTSSSDKDRRNDRYATVLSSVEDIWAGLGVMRSPSPFLFNAVDRGKARLPPARSPVHRSPPLRPLHRLALAHSPQYAATPLRSLQPDPYNLPVPPRDLFLIHLEPI